MREARADLKLHGRCGHEDVSHLEDVNILIVKM